MYNWITLLYTENQQNTVNQLYLNFKKVAVAGGGGGVKAQPASVSMDEKQYNITPAENFHMLVLF